jgi:hypothetical protein
MSAQNSPPTSPLSERRPTSLSSGQPSSASPLAVARPTNGELAPGEAKNIQQTLQEAANRPVKKKVVYKGEGSHVTSGVANTGPVGSAMDHNSESQNSPAQVSQIQSTNNGVGAPAPKKRRRKLYRGQIRTMKASVLVPMHPMPDSILRLNALLHSIRERQVYCQSSRPLSGKTERLKSERNEVVLM